MGQLFSATVCSVGKGRSKEGKSGNRVQITPRKKKNPGPKARRRKSRVKGMAPNEFELSKISEKKKKPKKRELKTPDALPRGGGKKKNGLSQGCTIEGSESDLSREEKRKKEKKLRNTTPGRGPTS